MLLRIVGDAVSFLPKCYEAQLHSGNAGGHLGVLRNQDQGRQGSGCAIIPRPRRPRRFCAGLGKIKGAEKKPGEWNKYEITFNGGDLTLLVNGEKVNEATGCDVVAGRIGLQSEGGEIHFRKVQLTPIEK